MSTILNDEKDVKGLQCSECDGFFPTLKNLSNSTRTVCEECKKDLETIVPNHVSDYGRTQERLREIEDEFESGDIELDNDLPRQEFRLTIDIVTACGETVTEADVEAWVSNELQGCDLAEIVKITAESNRRSTLFSERPKNWVRQLIQNGYTNATTIEFGIIPDIVKELREVIQSELESSRRSTP